MKQPVTLTELRDEIMRQLESSKVVTIKLAERGFLYELIASINDGIEGAKMRNELARRKMVLQICDSRFNRSRHQKHIRPVDVWYERRERLIRDFKKAEQARLQRERPTKKGKRWLDYTSIQSRHYRIDEQSKHPTPTTQSGGATRPPSG